MAELSNFDLEVAAEVEVVDSGHKDCLSLTSSTQGACDTTLNLTPDKCGNEICKQEKSKESSKFPKMTRLLSPKPTRPKMLGNLTFREIARRRKAMTKMQPTKVKHEGLNLNTSLASILQDSLQGTTCGTNKEAKMFDMKRLIGKTITLNPNTSQNVSIKFVDQEPASLLKRNAKLYKIDADLIFGNNKKYVTDTFQGIKSNSNTINPDDTSKELIYTSPNQTKKSYKHWNNIEKNNVRALGNNVFINKPKQNNKYNGMERTFKVNNPLKLNNPVTLEENHSNLVQNVVSPQRLSILSAVASDRLATEGFFSDSSEGKWKRIPLKRKSSPLKGILKNASPRNVPGTSTRTLRKDSEFTARHQTNYYDMLKANKKCLPRCSIKNNKTLINKNNRNHYHPEHKTRKTVQFKSSKKGYSYRNSGSKSQSNFTDNLNSLPAIIFSPRSKVNNSYLAEQFKENCNIKKRTNVVSTKRNLFPRHNKNNLITFNESERASKHTKGFHESHKAQSYLQSESIIPQDTIKVPATKKCCILLHRLLLPKGIENGTVKLSQNQCLNLNNTLSNNTLSINQLVMPKSSNDSFLCEAENRGKFTNSDTEKNFDASAIGDEFSISTNPGLMHKSTNQCSSVVESIKDYTPSKEILDYLQLKDVSDTIQCNEQFADSIKVKSTQRENSVKASIKVATPNMKRTEERKVNDNNSTLETDPKKQKTSLIQASISILKDSKVSEAVEDKKEINSPKNICNGKCRNNSEKCGITAIIKHYLPSKAKYDQSLLHYKPDKRSNMKLSSEVERKTIKITSRTKNAREKTVSEDVIFEGMQRRTRLNDEQLKELDPSISNLTEPQHFSEKNNCKKVKNSQAGKEATNDIIKTIDLKNGIEPKNLGSPETNGMKGGLQTETNTNQVVKPKDNKSSAMTKKMHKRSNAFLEFSKKPFLRSQKTKQNENPMASLSKARQKMMKLKYLNNLEYFSSNPKDKEFIEQISSGLKEKPNAVTKESFNINYAESALNHRKQFNVNKNINQNISEDEKMLGVNSDALNYRSKTIISSSTYKMPKTKKIHEKPSIGNENKRQLRSNSMKSKFTCSPSQNNLKSKKERNVQRNKSKKRCNKKVNNNNKISSQMLKASDNVVATANSESERITEGTSELPSFGQNYDTETISEVDTNDITEIVYSLPSYKNESSCDIPNFTVQNIRKLEEYSTPIVPGTDCNVLPWQPPMVVQHSQNSIICSNYGSPYNMGYNIYYPYQYIGQQTSYNIAALPSPPPLTIALVPRQSVTSNVRAPVRLNVLEEESDNRSRLVNQLTHNSASDKSAQINQISRHRIANEKRLLLKKYRKRKNLKLKSRKLSFTNHNVSTSNRDESCENTGHNVQQTLPGSEAGTSNEKYGLTLQEPNLTDQSTNLDDQNIPEEETSNNYNEDGCLSYNKLSLKKAELTAIREALSKESARRNLPGTAQCEKKVFNFADDLLERIGQLDAKTMKILVKLAYKSRNHQIKIVNPPLL